MISKQLSSREKVFLAGGAVALAVLVIVAGVIFPYRAAMSRMDSAIVTKQAQLEEIVQLRAKYLDLKAQASRLQRDLQRDRMPAPLTFLEETAVSVAGRESLVLMRPLPSVVKDNMRIESVEFKMERIGLEEVLRILWTIETARSPMRVDKLFLKQRFDDATQLDMNVTASAVRRS